MKKSYSFVLIFLSLINFTGCASAGVPLTSDPAKKLKYAEVLFNDNERPIPAQTLIFEAEEIYLKENNEIGLANTYRTYAFFLQSPTVGEWSKISFEDNSITHENRFMKAVEYWKKAIELYDHNELYNLSADCYFQLEKLYYIKFNDKEMACFYNQESKKSIKKYRKENPYTKLDAMGFENFEKFIEAAGKEIGCY